jgi:RNA polymerase sigma factor (sigma-70 family)
MNREEAKFAGDLGEEYRRPAWDRLLEMEDHWEYLRRRAELEGKDPAEFVERLRFHGWAARNDFRDQRHNKDDLTFREWLITRLVPAVIVTWEEFTRDKFDNRVNLAKEHLERISSIVAIKITVGWIPKHVKHDLIHDVWAAVMRGLLTYKPDKGNFRSWINRITVNMLKKEAKKGRSRNLSEEPPSAYLHPAAWSGDGTIDVVDTSEGPSEEVERREWFDDLMALIREWDEMGPEIFRLRFFEDMTFREMAQRLWPDDERPVKTFESFSQKPWEPTDDEERKRADQLRYRYAKILQKIREWGGEMS